MRVRLPVESSISLEFLDSNEDIRIEGKGRLAGVLLTRSDVDRPERPTLAAIRTSFCSRARCKASALNVTLFENNEPPQHSTTGDLPAGTYDLYLVADGSPVRVVLRLHGPDGVVRLRPNLPVQSDTYEPSRHLYADQAKNVYSDGRVIDASGGSLWTFSSYRIRGSAWNGGKFAKCIYRGEPPPRPVGFSPGCPGGIEFGALITRLDAPTGAYDHIHHGGALMAPAGTWGYGANYVTSGVVDDVEAVAAYLDLREL